MISHTGTNTINPYPLAGDDARLTYSNRAVEIWAGSELAKPRLALCYNISETQIAKPP